MNIIFIFCVKHLLFFTVDILQLDMTADCVHSPLSAPNDVTIVNQKSFCKSKCAILTMEVSSSLQFPLAAAMEESSIAAAAATARDNKLSESKDESRK